jgi:hypothetical protein
MSSQLTSLVAVFDGQNYSNWSKAMHAFLMAQGLWGFADGTNQKPATPVLPIPPVPLPTTPAPSQKQIDGHKVAENIYNAAKAEYDRDFPAHPALLSAWQKGNNMTLGNMTLRLSTAIQQHMDPLHDTEDTWDWLRDTFSVADNSSLHQARKLELKGKVGSSRSISKPDVETSHAPTTQDNCRVPQACIPLFKVRERSVTQGSSG